MFNKIKNYCYLGVIVVAMLNLTSCAVLAIGAVGAAVGTTAVVISDPRSSGQVFDDKNLALKLSYKLNQNFPNSNIYVTSYNNKILLTGQAYSNKDYNNIKIQTQQQVGDRKIYNYMTIRLAASFSARNYDSWITSQIKTKLLTSKNISSNDIKVVTTAQVVYLFGVVNSVEAKKITHDVATVNGVKKVITLFDYKNN